MYAYLVFFSLCKNFSTRYACPHAELFILELEAQFILVLLGD